MSNGTWVYIAVTVNSSIPHVGVQIGNDWFHLRQFKGHKVDDLPKALTKSGQIYMDRTPMVMEYENEKIDPLFIPIFKLQCNEVCVRCYGESVYR